MNQHPTFVDTAIYREKNRCYPSFVSQFGGCYGLYSAMRQHKIIYSGKNET